MNWKPSWCTEFSNCIPYQPRFSDYERLSTRTLALPKGFRPRPPTISCFFFANLISGRRAWHHNSLKDAVSRDAPIVLWRPKSLRNCSAALSMAGTPKKAIRPYNRPHLDHFDRLPLDVLGWLFIDHVLLEEPCSPATAFCLPIFRVTAL